MQSSFLRGSSVGHLAGVGRDASVLSQSQASFLKCVSRGSQNRFVINNTAFRIRIEISFLFVV